MLFAAAFVVVSMYWIASAFLRNAVITEATEEDRKIHRFAYYNPFEQFADLSRLERRNPGKRSIILWARTVRILLILAIPLVGLLVIVIFTGGGGSTGR